MRRIVAWPLMHMLRMYARSGGLERSGIAFRTVPYSCGELGCGAEKKRMDSSENRPWPDPLTARTASEFVGRMRQLKVAAGLSYRKLERRAAQGRDVLPASTLATALVKNALPREDLVAAFVRACGRDPTDWIAARRRLALQAVERSGETDPHAPDGPDGPAGSGGLRTARGSAGAGSRSVPVASIGAVEEIPHLGKGETGVSAASAGRLGARLRPVSRRLSRRRGWRPWLAAATAILVLIAAWAVAVARRDGRSAAAPGERRCAGPQLRLDLVTRECWGISDGSAAFPAFDPPLDQVVRRIYQQNRASAAAHRRQPQRPYVSLAYVGTLTTDVANPPALVVVREILEGIATAQQRTLWRTTPGAPLVNVLIAAAGTGMRHGVDVARMLSRRPPGEPTLVGVVGLDLSRQRTLDTIRQLGHDGIPMLAVALSADQFARSSQLYFQIAPQNKRAAAVAAAYAAATFRRAQSVRIYHASDPQDLYGQNLTADLAAAFHGKGLTVDRTPFRPGSQKPGAANRAGMSACGYHGLVYYAGGAEDFSDFLNGVYTQCGTTPPTILADDDVSRYVADPARRGLFPSVPFHFTAFAVAPENCQEKAGDTFYASLGELFPFECATTTGRSLSGYPALGYDAALTVLTAVEQVGRRATRDTLARALTGIHIGGAASAPITIGRDHVPVRKMVAIMNVAHDRFPTVEGTCGEGGTNPSWCP